MCGIAGIFGPEPHAREAIRDMVAALAHRGPDDEGFFVDGLVALGMRRLAIVDIAGGRQPQKNESGSISLVFNGEIYNHLDLRRELSGRGHVFRSNSDTEVIVHGYEQWGIDGCLERLRGIFAFLLWDSSERGLYAARDRLGVKPLYYARVGRQWRFASEIKGLLACADVPRAVDVEQIPPYLLHQYVPAPATLFRGIRKLLPGHYVRVGENDTLVCRPFWRLSFEANSHSPSFRGAVEAVRGHVGEAVRLRLMSDVPLGCLLSGGLDSSVVAGAMAQQCAEPVSTFTVGFPERADLDERPYARLVADKFATRHTELNVALEATSLLERVACYLDEPLADAAALPTYAICKAAREHVTVLLTGEGGDELFAGYPRYLLSRVADALRCLPAGAKGTVLQAVAALVPGARYKSALRKLAAAADDPLLRNALWTGVFAPGQIAQLLPGAKVPELAPMEESGWPYAGDDPPRGAVERLLYWDMRRWLVDDVLTKVDAMSMAASVEARVPLLDHQLVEYVLSLPLGYKLHAGRGKRVLREAFRNVLPQAILSRRKAAFRPPLDEWFRGSLGSWIAELTRGRGSFCKEFFEPRAVEQLIAEHAAGAASHGQRLWSLLCAELWYARWFGDGIPAYQPRCRKKTRSVLVVRDLPSEGWPSMDRYAQALLSHLPGEMRDGVVAASPVVSPNGHGLPAPVKRYWSRLVTYPRGLRSYRPAVVHVLDHTYAHILRQFPDCPSLVTVHDLWPFRRPGVRRGPRQAALNILRRHIEQGLRDATLLCAVSVFSAREAIDLLGVPLDRVRVVPNGVEESFFVPVEEEQVRGFRWRAFEDAEPCLLHVGSCDLRKNIEGLLRIVAHARGVAPKVRLLQVGGTFWPAHHTLMMQLGVEDCIIQWPRATEDELRLAYRAADVLVLPSSYEGFGFPVLEAQASQLPVVCSNRGSLPEVAGEGAVVLDLDDERAWVEAILRLTEDRGQRERMIASGVGNASSYTWQRTAAAVAAIYDELPGA